MARPFRFQLSTGATPDAAGWSDLARKVEDLGYSSLAVADHFDAQFAPLPALMASAEATTTLRVSPLVLCNDYRHPALLGKELATLDLLSEGRLEVGLGAGWMAEDYAKTGIRFDRAGLRIQRLDEAIDVLKASFSGRAFDHHGEQYKITQLSGFPLPTQQPHPPFLIAGGGRRILELAARQADIVGLHVSLHAGVIDERAGSSATDQATLDKIHWIKAASGPRFDDLEIHVRTHIAMVHDRPAEVAEMLGPAFGITPQDALRSPHALVGSVEGIVETLLERRERYGISYICWHQDSIDTLAPVVARLAGT